MKRFLLACVALLLTAMAIDTAIGDQIRRVDVQFAPGTSGASYSGTIRGSDTAEYRLGARAGQTMTVALRARNPSAYFNVTAQGSDTAIFVGQTSGNDFSGVLPANGTYIVQVYLVRAAARRNETADYTIDFRIAAGTADAPQPNVPPPAEAMPPLPKSDFADGYAGGPDFWEVTGLVAGDTLNLREGPSASERILAQLAQGAVVRNMGCRPVSGARWCRVQLQGDANAVGWVSGRYLREASGDAAPPADATVPGTVYRATGEVECKLPGGEAPARCRFGVVRRGKGMATLDITFPDGFKRTLTFSHGLVTAADRSTVRSGREGDDTIVTVNGNERFVVPDVVVDGD